MWIEMSRDDEHGGTGWGFQECLWSPTRTRTGTAWPFWQLSRVKEGDIVVHLRGKASRAAFVGTSIATSHGKETRSRPPLAKQWGFSESFFRVPLDHYVSFPEPIVLAELFRIRKFELFAYFQQNRIKPKEAKERLFYVVQGGRLQCLNGAYLSDCSDLLAGILFDFKAPDLPVPAGRAGPISVRTGECLVQMWKRLGQQRFSEEVRGNYENRCCFPGCQVADRAFLRGAHVARWADERDFRGDLANGLCLCLFHDRAFELGLFVVTDDFKVSVAGSDGDSPWALSELRPFDGQPLRPARVSPSLKLLQLHRFRVGLQRQIDKQD